MQKNLKKILSAVLTIVMLLSLCAPAFPVSAAEELTTIKKWNLILGDEIAANFYVNVSDAVSDSAVMHVTDGYGTHQYALTAAKKDDNGNYIFTARLAAAQLTDTITLQLYDGENVGAVHTYSAVDYAKSVMNGSYSESTMALVKAMLNYGAAAQSYFKYNTENLANAGYESTESVEVPVVDTTNMVSGQVDGISFYGASPVFESKVAVRFYFTVTGDINSYSFSTGTPVAKNGMYYIEVDGINPQDYATDIILTVNDALTVTYSPLTYISRKVGSDNTELVALVKAMYKYYLAAEAYISDFETVIPGGDFTAGKDLTINFEEGAYDFVSFDFKWTSGTKLFFGLCNPDWSKYYGMFEVDGNGVVGSYDGVTSEKLANDIIRVTIETAKVTRTNNADNADNVPATIDKFYIRGDWSDAAGTIDNIRCLVKNQQHAEIVVEGGEFTSGNDLTLSFEAGAYSKISMDYKIVAGNDVWFCFANSDLTKYYGYYWLITDGVAESYDGVTCELLDNGYIRVTLDIAQLNRTNHMWNRDNAPDAVSCLYIRGDWSNAAGFIDNIRLF